MVCLGNICRSPLAEAALRHEAEAAGLDIIVDSAGTGGWHVGDPPDPRAQSVAREHGVDAGRLRARQVEPADFGRFTHIYAMDRQNLADLRSIMPADATASMALLLDSVPGCEGREVADPYYGDAADFARCWDDVSRAARALVHSLKG